MVKRTNIKQFFATIGIAAGVVSIIMGFSVKNEYRGRLTMDKEFGGDAYTEIQHAVADAACNVYDTNCILAKGIGWFLVIFGVSDICFFGYKFAEASAAETPVQIENNKPECLPEL